MTSASPMDVKSHSPTVMVRLPGLAFSVVLTLYPVPISRGQLAGHMDQSAGSGPAAAASCPGRQTRPKAPGQVGAAWESGRGWRW